MDIVRRHFTIIESTNTWSKQNAHEFAKDKLTLVTADCQTAGRGRFNRKWVSPPKENIYATFCFFVENGFPYIGNIPQILAVSTANLLVQLDFFPQLKWPNDLLLSGKKVAGILAETTPLDNFLCVVIGIGLNVNMSLDTLKKIDRPATSLIVEKGSFFDPETLIQKLAEIFNRDLTVFFAKGFSHFLPSYKKYTKRYIESVAEHKVCFHDNQKIWEGTFKKINDDGSLSLTLLNGKEKTFIAGEILWG